MDICIISKDKKAAEISYSFLLHDATSRVPVCEMLYCFYIRRYRKLFQVICIKYTIERITLSRHLGSQSISINEFVPRAE